MQALAHDRCRRRGRAHHSTGGAVLSGSGRAPDERRDRSLRHWYEGFAGNAGHEEEGELRIVSISVTRDIAPGATATFSVFLTASSPVAFDPAAHRVTVRFEGPDGVTRGLTTVAVQTAASR